MNYYYLLDNITKAIKQCHIYDSVFLNVQSVSDLNIALWLPAVSLSDLLLPVYLLLWNKTWNIIVIYSDLHEQIDVLGHSANRRQLLRSMSQLI